MSSILILSTNQFAVVPDQLHAAFSPIPPEAGMGRGFATSYLAIEARKVHHPPGSIKARPHDAPSEAG